MEKCGQKKEKETRRTIFMVFFILTLIAVVFLAAWRPLLVSYLFRVAKLLVSEVTKVMNDKQSFIDNELQFAAMEWRLYEIESRFGQDWCKENVKSRSDVTWLTVVVNDEFIPPALNLAHSLRTFSCNKNMISFISEELSEGAVKALQNVGWETRVVEEMDCSWLDAKIGRGRNNSLSSSLRGARGAHTRFHAWNYTEYSKIIYVDADYMLMTNIDELFDLPDDFAATPCSRPGVIDFCLNAGLLVFRPDSKVYQEIMNFWRESTEIFTCVNDQSLLYMYFLETGKWKTLPYAYNVRRIVFRPMKAFHFSCCRPPKPWSAECRPSRREVGDFKGPVLTLDDTVLVYWKAFYDLLKKYKLERWWRSTKFFRPAQEFGNVTYTDCWKQDPVPVVQKADNSIHRINNYPLDNVHFSVNIYPLDSGSSDGERYPLLKQPGQGLNN